MLQIFKRLSITFKNQTLLFFKDSLLCNRFSSGSATGSSVNLSTISSKTTAPITASFLARSPTSSSRSSSSSSLSSLSRTTTPTNFSRAAFPGSSGCQVINVRGYLKNKCLTSGGDEYYTCWGSSTKYKVTIESCDKQTFTAVCPDDPKYYQLCGFIDCEHRIDDQFGFCGNYICDNLKYDKSIFSSSYYRDQYTCNGYTVCHGNNASELNCEAGEKFKCSFDNSELDAFKICDGKSDCHFGTDELFCNHMHGIICKISTYKGTVDTWVPPISICDGWNNCDGGEDEVSCANSTHHAGWCRSAYNKLYYLNASQMCGPLDKAGFMCADKRDQLNCTDAVMECLVENTTTRLRSTSVCDKNWTCDDGFDEVCVEAEQNCFIHKHQLCDNKTDCDRNGDENHESCRSIIDDECERIVGGTSTRIPLDWLCDGVVDCKDGKDEDKYQWKVCGAIGRQRCIPKTQLCQELFRCSESETEFVEPAKLCDNVDSCPGENSVCHAAKDTITPVTHVRKVFGTRRVSYCLPGINSRDLECNSTVFKRLENVTENLIKPFSILFPTQKPRCSFLFGEAYVYTSCNGNCQEMNAVCPLPIIDSSSCITMPGKIMVPTLTNQLTVVMKKKDLYSNEIFSCKNGNCLSYDKVCNMADECGDGSDEESCINNFKCNSSDRKYLRVESRCDGRIDCPDLSNECNGQCGERIINDPKLRAFAWIVGIMASSINVCVLARNGKDLFGAESKVQLINSSMIFIISFGDLFIGLYLLCIVIADHLNSVEYCPEQLKWLVSRKCSLLGIASTIGSQVSLFSMTCLSLYRANSMRNLLAPRHLSRRAAVMTFLGGASIFLASTAIAVLPELKLFEDYFINGIYYPDSPMFIGAPNKEKHLKIIEKRFGRFSSKQDISWETIRIFISEMFTNDHGGVEGKSLGFYGNDGVCLFKFFVTSDDPQHIFSLSILVLNFICFIMITGSYIIINYISMASSAASSGDSASSERTKKMQRKITVIILTDFLCWIPFIVISLLHFGGSINASKYYGLCSIIVLPLNSVVNPMLYDGSVVDLLTSNLKRADTVFNNSRIGRRCSSAWNSMGNQASTLMSTIRRTPVTVSENQVIANPYCKSIHPLDHVPSETPEQSRPAAESVELKEVEQGVDSCT